MEQLLLCSYLPLSQAAEYQKVTVDSGQKSGVEDLCLGRPMFAWCVTNSVRGRIGALPGIIFGGPGGRVQSHQL